MFRKEVIIINIYFWKVHSTLRKFGLHCDHALMAPLCPCVNYVSERSYYYQHLLLKGMRCITNKSCQMGVEVCGIIKIGFTLQFGYGLKRKTYLRSFTGYFLSFINGSLYALKFSNFYIEKLLVLWSSRSSIVFIQDCAYCFWVECIIWQ
jgi:hypothetical protein